MNKLSPRLQTISTLVSKENKVIDIGCDHALLDIYLYQNQKITSIIVSDINKKALEHAITNLKVNHLDQNIQARLGDGLNVINKEDDIDTIIISGMGAHTILGILKNNLAKLKKIKTLIIQSNNQHAFLRKAITKLKYFISDETIIKDHEQIYITIKFARGKKRYSSKEYYFGPILLKENSQIFKEYQKMELKKLNILKKIIPRNKLLRRYKLFKEIRLYK